MVSIWIWLIVTVADGSCQKSRLGRFVQLILVMDFDGLAVEGAFFVGIRGQLDRDNGAGLGAGLLGKNGPEAAIVLGYGYGQKGVQRAGVEVGQKDGGGVGSQAGSCAAAVGGDVEQNLCRVRSSADIDGGVVDGGAELHVAKLIGGGELLCFRQRIVEALHGDADDRGGVITLGVGGERDCGVADGLAVLGDGEAAGLRGGGDEAEERGEGKYSELAHRGLHHHSPIDAILGGVVAVGLLKQRVGVGIVKRRLL